MDKFKQLLSGSITELTRLADSGVDDAQLSSFHESLTKEVIKLASAAPRAIKMKIQLAFTDMSWDLRLNSHTGENPLDAQTSISAITKLLEDLSSPTPPVVPTSEELDDFSKACDKLWDLDINRLQPSHDYEINIQEGKKIYDTRDKAHELLFSYVDERVFEKPTYKAFISLLDNYEANQGTSEYISYEERNETIQFLHLIMSTPCIQYIHNYLKMKNLAPSSSEGFFTMLANAWFGTYRRVVKDDTCGFEHVFVGEIEPDGDVSGMHNWIQLYLEEKKGKLDYLGYIRPRYIPNMHFNTPDNHQQLISIQFNWNGNIKNVSTSFIGVSPEFEFALYSLAYFTHQQKSVVEVGPYHVEVTAYDIKRDGKRYIGTCFPCEAPEKNT